jgi:hypothetical protein
MRLSPSQKKRIAVIEKARVIIKQKEAAAFSTPAWLKRILAIFKKKS